MISDGIVNSTVAGVHGFPRAVSFNEVLGNISRGPGTRLGSCWLDAHPILKVVILGTRASHGLLSPRRT